MRFGGSLAAAIVLLAACSSTSLPAVQFDGDTCSYEGPTELSAAKPVAIDFRNDSEDDASLLTFRLAATTDLGDIADAAATTAASALIGGGQMDIPSAQRLDVASGRSATMERAMGAGSYAVTCLVEADDRLVVATRIEVKNG